MRLSDYRQKFNKWCETFCPEDYGYTWEDYDNGKIDLKEEFIIANYGNSTTATYLRNEL